MLAEVDSAQRQTKMSTAIAINDFTGDMEKAYVRVALSDTHERSWPMSSGAAGKNHQRPIG